MDFYIQNFGAVGDGKTLNTAALQAAIDAAGEQNGRVVVENGIFKIGSVAMKSNVELHIAATGVLLGSDNPEDYSDFKELTHMNWEMAPRRSNSCLILIHECQNTSITGYGTIDCNGQHFVVPDPGNRICSYKRIDGFTPPRVVLCTGSQDITFKEVAMINQPGGWSYWIHDCDRVTVKDLTIRASVEYPNNDGVHINCSRDVTVSGCDIFCSDDCLVVRANSATLRENKPCERIRFSDCKLTSYSAGMRIGWVNDGVIRDVSASNLIMTDCSVGVSLYIPALVRSERITDVGREATRVEKFRFQNLSVESAGYPVFIRLADRPEVMIDKIQDIEFENMTVRSPQLPYIEGKPGVLVENVRFVNCDFTRTDSTWCEDRPCTGYLMTPNQSYTPLPMTLRYTKNIQFIRTSISDEE